MRNSTCINSLLIGFFILISNESLYYPIAQPTEDDTWIIFSCGRVRTDNYEIYRVRPDGTELQQLTDNNISDFSPRWSPDGDWIVYVGEWKEITFFWTDNDAEIYRVRPDGTELQQLTDNNLGDNSPRWSPDGEWIAYAVDNSEIYRMRPDGSEQQRLTQVQDADLPTWSPDGEWIAFVSDRSEVYRVRPDGTDLELVAEADNISELAWSPDGEWIAFISNRSNIYRVRPDGENLQLLTSTSMRRVSQLSWSPDGEWIAFSASNNRLGSDLFKITADGSEIEQLTDLSGAILSLTWSPDGRKIAFSSNYVDVGGFFQIYLIRPDGGDIQLLSNMPCHAGSPAWLQHREESKKE